MRSELSRGDEVYGDHVFQVLAEYEISRSIRYPTPVGILIVEMSATAPDEAAQQAAPKVFASALNAHLRSVDIPSVNGREYRILLPTTHENGLRAVCERLLSIFRTQLTTREGLPVAFSLNLGGAAHGGGPSLSYQWLVERAASALQKSKLKGPHTYVIGS